MAFGNGIIIHGVSAGNLAAGVVWAGGPAQISVRADSFTRPEEPALDEILRGTRRQNPPNILAQWVDEIGLSRGAVRILFRERIATVTDLVRSTKESLLGREGMTEKMLLEVRLQLRKLRLALGQPLNQEIPKRSESEIAAARQGRGVPVDVDSMTQVQRFHLHRPVSALKGLTSADLEFLAQLEIRFVGDLVQRTLFELNTARLESQSEKDRRIRRLQTALAEVELQLEMPLIGFRAPEDFDDILDQPIEALNLNRRLQRCLKNNGILRVGQLPSIFEELKPGEKKLRGLRREDAQTIREALAARGIEV